MTPFLVGNYHGKGKIPLDAFTELKRVCGKLFGEKYCLLPTSLKSDHYAIKVIRLS